MDKSSYTLYAIRYFAGNPLRHAAFRAEIVICHVCRLFLAQKGTVTSPINADLFVGAFVAVVVEYTYVPGAIRVFR